MHFVERSAEQIEKYAHLASYPDTPMPPQFYANDSGELVAVEIRKCIIPFGSTLFFSRHGEEHTFLAVELLSVDEEGHAILQDGKNPAFTATIRGRLFEMYTMGVSLPVGFNQ